MSLTEYGVSYYYATTQVNGGFRGVLCLLRSLDQRSPIIFWRVFHCLLRVLLCETVSQSFFAQGFIKACAEGDLKYQLVWTLNLKSGHSIKVLLLPPTGFVPGSP